MQKGEIFIYDTAALHLFVLLFICAASINLLQDTGLLLMAYDKTEEAAYGFLLTSALWPPFRAESHSAQQLHAQ